MGAFADLQKAVFGRLGGSPALAAIAGARIYDDVPHNKEAAAPAFPHVTIGEQSGQEDGASDIEAASVSITIHAWSRMPGRLQCLEMLDAIRDALHDQPLVVSNGIVVRFDYQEHETVKEADGETYHGLIRFEGLYQYG